MENINIAFHVISLLLALLAATLLFLFNTDRKHSNRLLAVLIMLFALQNLVFLLLFTKIMLKVPWMLRVPAPTTFLFGPLAYLYLRSVLNEEIKFKKYDWLLLLPSLLAFINFIPFYLLPNQEKINYLLQHFYNQAQTQDPGKGILPSVVYYLVRIFWSGVFLFLNFRLISRFRNTSSSDLVGRNKKLLNWLFTFNLLLAVLWIATVLRVYVPTLRNTQLTIADLVLGFTILFICLQLFIRPQILYGIHSPVSQINGEIFIESSRSSTSNLHEIIDNNSIPSDFESGGAKTKAIDLQAQIKLKEHVESYLNEQKAFLNPDYSLEQMAADVEIPRYLLSAFINREYGMGFREFLNRYRVQYFLDNLHTPSWSNLTLEAIAWQCGFNSRSTFINHSKKMTGKTPSEFMKVRPGK